MKCSALRASLLPALLLALAPGGCVIGESTIGLLDDTDTASSTTGDDEPATTSTASENGTDENGTGEDGTGEASTGGEPPASCPPKSQCSVPLECSPTGFEPCGGILGRSDANGCPRQPCSASEDCPAGTTCFLPYSWLQCGQHGCQDDPETGTCECGFGLDCNNDGLCVPDDEGLPPDVDGTQFCGALTDPTSCDDSGLPTELGECRWYEGFEMPLGGTCEERVPVARCTFNAASFSPGPLPSCAGDETRSPLAYVDGDAVTVLFVDPSNPPTALEYEFDGDTYGWYPCEVASVEAECACACG